MTVAQNISLYRVLVRNNAKAGNAILTNSQMHLCIFVSNMRNTNRKLPNSWNCLCSGDFLMQKFVPHADRRENTSDPRYGRQDVSFREGFWVSRSGVSRTAQGLPVPSRLCSLRQHWSHHGVPGETPGWLEAAACGASASQSDGATVGRWTSHWRPYRISTQTAARPPRPAMRGNYRTLPGVS